MSIPVAKSRGRYFALGLAEGEFLRDDSKSKGASMVVAVCESWKLHVSKTGRKGCRLETVESIGAGIGEATDAPNDMLKA